ncbi:MAG: hypothetical protein ACLPNY_10365, partial [Roseiarcus sp.]
VDLSFLIVFLASASAAPAGPPSQGLIGARDGQQAAGEKKRRPAAHRPSEIPHHRPSNGSRLEDSLCEIPQMNAGPASIFSRVRRFGKTKRGAPSLRAANG